MNKHLSLLILFLALFIPVFSQDDPPTADAIMNKAIQKAQDENKHIFLMFHASWCGWCKKMDKAMADDACRDFFEDNFVTIHMVVKESPANKHLENPGADELLAKYKGETSGIPFWLIFNKNGDFITDSFMKIVVGEEIKSGNIGCPATDEEVSAFIDKLKLVTQLTESEEKSITERFRQNRN